MDSKILVYAMVIVAVAVMAWAVTTVMGGKDSAEKYQYYNNLQQQSADGCGDLTDNENVQHLSHHPGQYAECIKMVDAQKFKEAVGTEKQTFLKQNGIE